MRHDTERRMQSSECRDAENSRLHEARNEHAQILIRIVERTRMLTSCFRCHAPVLRENKILMFLVIQFVIICSARPGRI